MGFNSGFKVLTPGYGGGQARAQQVHFNTLLLSYSLLVKVSN